METAKTWPVSLGVVSCPRFSLRFWSAALVVFIAASAIVPVAAVEDYGNEVRGYYLGGGTSFGGVRRACLQDHTPSLPEWQVDIGAACDLRCPGNTCDISVLDDYYGDDVLFKVCFDNEDFCRWQVYRGYAYVLGARVTVVPFMETATHGVVIIR